MLWREMNEQIESKQGNTGLAGKGQISSLFFSPALPISLAWVLSPCCFFLALPGPDLKNEPSVCYPNTTLVQEVALRVIFAPQILNKFPNHPMLIADDKLKNHPDPEILLGGPPPQSAGRQRMGDSPVQRNDREALEKVIQR